MMVLVMNIYVVFSLRQEIEKCTTVDTIACVFYILNIL